MKSSGKKGPPSFTLPWLESLPSSKIVLALSLLGVLAYANALQGEFVYDDVKYIVNNQSLRGPLDLIKVFATDKLQFTESYSTDIPLPYHGRLFTLWMSLNFRWFQFWPPGWHLLSLVLHLGVTALVFFTLRELLGHQSLSALAAAIFAAHPIHSQAVAWISAGAHVLLTLFFLASLLAYRRATETRSVFLWCLALAFFALSLLCKESALCLPVLIFLMEWLLPQAGPQSRRAALFVQKSRSILLRVCGFIATGLLYLTERYHVLGFLSWQHPFNQNVSYATVLLTLPLILWEYLWHLLFPVQLSLLYGADFVRSAVSPNLFIPLSLLALTGFALSWIFQKLRGQGQKSASNALLLSAVFFIVPLLPVLNLKAFHPEYLVQDRYAYLPSVGYCLLLSVGLIWLTKKAKSTALQMSFITVVILLLLLGAMRENKTWRNATALWTRAEEHRPHSWHVRYNRGLALLNQRQFLEARKEFEEALTRSPNNPQVLNNLGLAQAGLNHNEAALQSFLRSIEIDPNRSEPLSNLGTLEYRLKKLDEAEEHLSKAVRLNPSSTGALFNLGRLYLDRGEMESALAVWSRLLSVDPQDAEARWELGVTLKRLNRFEEARAQWSIALQHAKNPALRQKIMNELSSFTVVQ